MHFTTYGHYAIPLNDINSNLKPSHLKTQGFLKFYLLWTILDKNQKKEKKCIAKELHKRFGHPYSTMLINLIIDNILLIIDNIEQKKEKEKKKTNALQRNYINSLDIFTVQC